MHLEKNFYVVSLSSSVEQQPTRSSLPTGKRSIDGLLADSLLVAPAEIRFFFPDAPLLATASDLQGLGPLWALNTETSANQSGAGLHRFPLALGNTHWPAGSFRSQLSILPAPEEAEFHRQSWRLWLS
jgi:hypothetical protein